MFGKGKERDISVTLQSTKGSKKEIVTASMVAHTCDPSSRAGASKSLLSSRPSQHIWCVLGQPGLCSEGLSQNKNGGGGIEGMIA